MFLFLVQLNIYHGIVKENAALSDDEERELDQGRDGKKKEKC